ncbi:GFA family protein [Bradyrhizobium sp. 83012]|uniref:GFA family protein n=1 Tax=Bradyrhizobium aeschynomenes TaxID=2734909 RepID=A0ABX2CGR6_9BRAD|nr:GFA family protein [Bradyrhizobium aeschynomenes]NPU13296.1 GFA family protein [Bradyrhizobium aeschynomenes]NPU66504.1 GFA family protein [Bradyrhizobium aeschynomenes]NPV20216.1 GFA family protein [Bradyrhizobium aeschynomenes]
MTAFRGSCLCGEVAFAVDGPFDKFLNCHCSRCRKASGTAHSCEVIVRAAALRWLHGEASVTRFDLPQARSFATAFCSRCGSPMPHLTRSGREAIVPAGSFDQPLGTAPDRHVHWTSRADWYVHGERLLIED